MAIFDATQRQSFLTVLATSPFSSYTGNLSGWGTLLGLLNAPSLVQNPVPQGQVPANDPMDETAILALLSSASATNLINYVNLSSILLDISNNNYNHIVKWAQRLQIAELITSSEAAAINTYATETVADPNYHNTVPTGPTPFQNLFPGVTFTHPDGSQTTNVCTGDMLVEVLG